jgi:hypothetical protein
LTAALFVSCRAIETIRAGEVVYSRDEWDPKGAVEAKVVEAVFERFAGVLHLHLGGQLVRTTAEHPFYAAGKGWTPAFELNPGDGVLTAAGTWVRVDEVFDTGEWQAVYNLRVADHHTYFVGDDGWGWAAWAHNFYLTAAEVNKKTVLVIGAGTQNFVSADWKSRVKNTSEAFSNFPTFAAAQAEASRITELAKVLWEALKAQNAKFSDTMSDGLFRDFGMGYKGDFSPREEAAEEKSHSGTTGLFYALMSAQKHGVNGKDRPRLSWEQAESVFDAVNREMRGKRGFVLWVAPQRPTDAQIDALQPTNPPHGKALPAAQANPAYAMSDGKAVYEPHKVAANYERVLAYQVHQGGTFGAAEIVVWWGAPIGQNGQADAISVNSTTGQVTLWDSKAYAQKGGEIESDTFSVKYPTRRANAVRHAREQLNKPAIESLLGTTLKDAALDSINNVSNKYRMVTVRYLGSSGGNFAPIAQHETPNT